MSFIRHHFDAEFPEHSEHDDVLMAFGLALITVADGGLDDEEAALLDSFRESLPDWKLLSRSNAFNDAVESKLQSAIEEFSDKHGDDVDMRAFAVDATRHLADITSEAVRRRCFVLSVDLAMAAGGIEEAEDDVLKQMAEVLQIEAATVETVVRVLTWKYLG